MTSKCPSDEQSSCRDAPVGPSKNDFLTNRCPSRMIQDQNLGTRALNYAHQPVTCLCIFVWTQIMTLQLDWTSNTSRQKINLPTNQKGYDKSETTDEKLSARRIQICRVYFCLGIILKVILNNFQNNA